mgnify:CR=1 FL=1|jgi:hypothetical protein
MRIKKIKKITGISFLLIFMYCILFISFAACSKNTEGYGQTEGKNQSSVTDSIVETTLKHKSYYFVYKDMEIGINNKAKPVLEALGEPKNYFEAKSCAFDGMDRIYTYSGVDITTYTEGDSDEFVFAILFLDDSVKTTEGILLGSEKEDVIAAYGEKYEKSQNQLTYKDNDTKLSFIFEGDEVVSIEYSLIIDD